MLEREQGTATHSFRSAVVRNAAVGRLKQLMDRHIKSLLEP